MTESHVNLALEGNNMSTTEREQIGIEGLISIIIPVYNAEQYLDLCLKTITGQSYHNLEVILINDGSADNSGALCDKWIQKDNRIHVIHTQNQGPAAARNIGLENFKGEFVFFLDADDFLEPQALGNLIKNYNLYKADIIVGDFTKVKDGLATIHDEIFPNSCLLEKRDIIESVRNYLRRPNRFLLFAFSWGRLFRASIIREHNIRYNVNLHTFEDVDS